MRNGTTLRAWHIRVIAALLFFLPSLAALAQVAVMPLGDSITHGGQGYASYRYELWYALEQGGYDIDLVGDLNDIFGGSANPVWYPEYDTTFDRDHEGHWGWRTDQIADIIIGTMTANQPDIVLVHLGTNDIGQLGASGVTNADVNLRLIIERMRSVRPTVIILLAQVIPIGPGSSYYLNADQVDPLNAVIAAIAAEETTPASPIILVDQHNGFDLDTMMQADGLHPDLDGESQMALVWTAVLGPLVELSAVDPSVQGPMLTLWNAPNPFNPSTTIRYDLDQSSLVALDIFDLEGKLVINLLAPTSQAPGHHEVSWDGGNTQGVKVPSGVYFVRGTAANTVEFTKMLLVK